MKQCPWVAGFSNLLGCSFCWLVILIYRLTIPPHAITHTGVGHLRVARRD